MSKQISTKRPEQIRMFLVPCSCGATFSVAPDFDRLGTSWSRYLICPNCGKRHERAHRRHKTVQLCASPLCHDSGSHTNLPGFNIPCGSKACLIVRCRARTSFETAKDHHGFLARPMPCSPVASKKRKRQLPGGGRLIPGCGFLISKTCSQ